MRYGTYVLFIHFDDPKEMTVGALGAIRFHGDLCYIGSAMNGLDQRISRHLSKDKKIHWHIDNITVAADSIEAFESPSYDECGLRRKAEEAGMIPAVKGFGCSDCRCDTHLLRSDEKSRIRLIESERLTMFRDRRSQ
jgi:Uncharacterized conserved protein